MKLPDSISDQAFIEQFENQTLPPELFNHHGHLRLAWLYLQRYPLQQAIEKVTTGISAYASSLGAKDKFQHTLTEAIVRIMALRKAQSHADTLESYLADNYDLVDSIGSVVGTYYSQELLNSEQARSGFMSPDLAPFDSVDAA